MRAPVWGLLVLAGCPWVGREGLDRVRDVDGDGLVAERFDGRDCDDNDPLVGDCDADRDGHRALGFGDDCDDTDPMVNPDAAEACVPVGRDEDCDGLVDDADTVDDELRASWFVDGDGDGYGADTPVRACAAPPGTVDNDLDCDDTSSAVSPAAEERCDAVDRNCDGEPQLDAVDAVDWYADGDGDGFGRADAFVVRSCDPPADAGVLAGGNLGDCDDSDPARYPGAQEVCGGLDDDCDGLVDDANGDLVADPWYRDEDGDGVGQGATVQRQCGQPAGFVPTPGDCDDGDPDVTTQRTWFVDADGDGFGQQGADPGAGEVIEQCARPAGFVANDEDCDDDRSSVNVIAQELCNGFDDNCNGLADDDDPDVAAGYPWYFDEDGDGFGVVFAGRTDPGIPSDSPIYACVRPAGPWTGLAGDCDDTLATVSPVIPERCNGVDDNCDGQVDLYAVDEVTMYADLDGDGFGDASDPGTTGCPVGAVALNSADCDDLDAQIRPSAPEVCDGVDNDCDALVDDDDPNAQQIRHFRDGDGDGVGVAGVFVDQCVPPGGFVPEAGDCDDADADVQLAVAFVPSDHPTVAGAASRVCEGGAVLLDPASGPYPVGGVVPRSMLIASDVAGVRAAVCPSPAAPVIVIPQDASVTLQDLTITSVGAACGGFAGSAWIRADVGSSLALDHVDGSDLEVVDFLIGGTGADLVLERVDLARVGFTGTSSSVRRAVVNVSGGSLQVVGLSVDATSGRVIVADQAAPLRLVDVQLGDGIPGGSAAAVELRRTDDGLIRALDARRSGLALSLDRGVYQVVSSRFAGTLSGSPPLRLCDTAGVRVSSTMFVGGDPIRVMASGVACPGLGGLTVQPAHAFDGSVFALMSPVFDGPLVGGGEFSVERSVFVATGGIGHVPDSSSANVARSCSALCPSEYDACYTDAELDFVLAPANVCANPGALPAEHWLLAPRDGSVLLPDGTTEDEGFGVTAGRFPQTGWLPTSDEDGDGLPDAWELFFTGDPVGVDPAEDCVGAPSPCVLGSGFDDGVWPVVPADAFPLRAP